VSTLQRVPLLRLLEVLFVVAPWCCTPRGQWLVATRTSLHDPALSAPWRS